MITGVSLLQCEKNRPIYRAVFYMKNSTERIKK